MAVAQDKRASELTAPVSIAATDMIAGYRPGTGGEPNLDIKMAVGLIRDQVPAAGVMQSADDSFVERALSSILTDTRNFEWFGAVGDGVANDTSALQAAMTWLANGGTGGRKVTGSYGKIYKITAAIIMPVAGFWHLEGNKCQINQATDNVPIFHFYNENSRDYVVSGFVLNYVNTQPTTNTLAVHVYFDTQTNLNYGHFLGRFCNMDLLGGYRGFANMYTEDGGGTQTSNRNPVWGMVFRDIRFGSAMTGQWFWFKQKISGMPNNKFEHIYGRRISGVTTSAIDISGAVSPHFSCIEINSSTFKRQIFIENTLGFTIDTIRFEQVTVGTADDGIILTSGSYGKISNVQFQTIVMDTTGSMYLFRNLLGAITVEGITMIGLTATGAGIMYTFSSVTGLIDWIGAGSFTYKTSTAALLADVISSDDTVHHVARDGWFMAFTTYDPPSLAAGAIGAEVTVVAKGAAISDQIAFGFSLATQGVQFLKTTVAADSIKFIPWNPTAGTIDLASGTHYTWWRKRL